MCKVMMICGIDPKNGPLVEKFIRKSVKHMSKADNDGIGYVALGENGIFGERWLNNDEAFRRKKVFSKDQKNISDFFGTAVLNNFVNYSSFGEGSIRKASSILLHTRFATCDKNMTNTHPFVIKDTALIHNGVITNSDDIMEGYESERISTCDSEAILQEYLSSKVNEEPENIQDVADVLDGWYVAGLLTKNENGRDIVDIFKCNYSSLYVGVVPELEAFVFCTEIGILKETARDAGMTVSAYDEVTGGSFIRLDAVTGDRIRVLNFKPEPLIKKMSHSNLFNNAVGDEWENHD